MCGIVGILSYNEKIDKELIQEMCNIMWHRGPDNEGIVVKNTSEFSVGLGHRRLSIIDLTPAGNQPMSNERGDIWVVYNGEIYNHLDIRKELEQKGHYYRSRTDTETIIHAYEEYGFDCLRLFDGMFAFALYDERKKRLILARDRMGIKPLYYFHDDKHLIFASEIKALLLHPMIDRQIDFNALNFYLSLGCTLSPDTMFRGIKKLPPGYFLLLEKGGVSTKKYCTFMPNPENSPKESQNVLITKTRSLFEESVKKHLMSDVPLGVFLSGGLDSSAIVSIVKKFRNEPTDTFTVGYTTEDSAKFNVDLLHARYVANYLGTLHHEIIINNDASLAQLLPILVAQMDEPTFNPTAICIHFVCKLAKEHGITVLLSGDGSDEIFGGYGRYILARYVDFYSRFPWVSKFLLPVSKILPNRLRHSIKALDEKFQLSAPERYLSFGGSNIVKNELLVADILENIDLNYVSDVINSLMETTHVDSFLEKMVYADVRFFIQEETNLKVDKMGMLNSVEVRVPFQDQHIVEFVLNIPMARKIKFGTLKYILKKSVSDILPPPVLQRKKWGFFPPTSSWLRGGLKHLVFDVLSKENVERVGIFNFKQVERIVKAHIGMQQYFARELWLLLCFHLWWLTYLNK